MTGGPTPFGAPGDDPEEQGPGGPHDGDGGGDGPAGPPRIPLPRTSVEDTGLPLPDPAPPTAPPASLVLEHHVLKALLGAWALAACSAEEALAVEEHLGSCGACADEARRLREAVGLLHPPESLDLDPSLRTQVLGVCLRRRPPRIPVPGWAAPYDAETARLDALLQDIGTADWHAPVRLRWFEGVGPVSRRTTVAGVIAHLLTVDGMVAAALGLDDPLGGLDAAGDEPVGDTPAARTEAYWKASHFPPSRALRAPWRQQSHDIVRTTSFTGGGGPDGSDNSGRLPVSYGGFELPLRDAMLDRAFECWIHAEDIAEAVDYPYEPPSGRDLHGMIDLAARMLPVSLAERRRTGLASPPPPGRHLVPAGAPGRSLRLEIEGSGGGEWLIPLDSPAALGSADHEVAHVALDGVEFCRLAAGHVPPEEAAAGQAGDREAIKDVLLAAASLSRM
ncbi:MULTISPECIES: zf-HC2 domain-containing protein [Streptomyces]|uniref:zf-HC2 domain-containing protein n=1 Tax=Streptomyces TaxID=1883 RepID=UPI000BD23A60|nr:MULTISPECIES: zf-HC2 domain-containing protein [Streptomyces]MDX2515600.1 zf-HC2 domain-containing protein [Streptomyces stelliscabiei]MDX2552198.1 zf-HC2 domain-containing protein [Streptomyces stelliscabiei]MDX2609434.1 zf-HC2 domain-containing protein [Streptomyces stelliscabiei]MDX2636637.1 zf-HC2 domain-containing protein [Streptomyces stelliscabiei]MDX2660069.1 zf-HC2 domain-containing protein [Streptomyces stelliscabiei]